MILMPRDATADFSRYELWVKANLTAERLMLAVAPTLKDAQDLADDLCFRTEMASIDYISLHGRGRTERSWVREIETGAWKELGAPAPVPETESPSV